MFLTIFFLNKRRLFRIKATAIAGYQSIVTIKRHINLKWSIQSIQFVYPIVLASTYNMEDLLDLKKLHGTIIKNT